MKSNKENMSLGEKSIRVIEFTGKKKDFDPLSEKFLARAEIRGYSQLLTSNRSRAGIDKVPSKEECEKAVVDDKKNAIEVDRLNKLGCLELVLSMNADSSEGKIAFCTVKSCKTKEFPNGNPDVGCTKTDIGKFFQAFSFLC